MSLHINYDSFDGTSCFQQDEPPKYVKLTLREDDPNVSRNLEDSPDEEDEAAYIDMHSDKGEKLIYKKDWL